MILIAGIGNLLRADDGFGCQVVRRLQAEPLPAGVEARDFGARGHDLAFALCQGWRRVILVDTVGLVAGEPGSLHWIEPRAAAAEALGAHGVTPEHVLNLVQQLGVTLPPLVLLGCVPQNLGEDDELDDTLSAPVALAVERAVELLREMVMREEVVCFP